MSKIDQLDQRLIELLSEDGHQSTQRLAVQLSVSAATARRRLRMLAQSGALRIVAVPNAREISQPLRALIALKVDLDKIEVILRTLSQRPECRWVATTTGRFDILAIERFHCTEDLGDFLQKEIAKVHGIRDIETFICIRVHKAIYMPRAVAEIGQLDRRLIALLSEDGRQSAKRLAAQLSVSAATARRSLRRLSQSGALRIVALPNPYEIEESVVAMIALKVDLDKIEVILRTLSQRPGCRFIATTTGRFDILAIEWFHSNNDTADFLQKEIAKVHGIRDIETFVCIRAEKSIYMRGVQVETYKRNPCVATAL